MGDFPDNFDYVVYGTGVTESVISAALSTTGYSVLHIDKNDYYGGYSGSLRLGELLELLQSWEGESHREVDSSRPFRGTADGEGEIGVKHANHSWFVLPENEAGESDVVNGNDTEEPCQEQICKWTIESLRKRLRTVDIELRPRLLLCESNTVDALIQSDVKRYLEFQFVSKFGIISENNKLLLIPINRSDIVKTKVFSLVQKRRLSSFLEWCFIVDIDDQLIQRYDGVPLRELMKKEKDVDEFTVRVILECLVLSSLDVETKQGILKLKRLLHSFNKVGPYPMLWPNYGSGEIPQAFCRMSAVFGGVYSLGIHIAQIGPHASENGHGNESLATGTSSVAKEQRKLAIKLSNDSTVYTDRLVTHKSLLNPSVLTNISETRWISRAILVTTSSLIEDKNRQPHDLLLLPLHFNETSKPIILLEIPIERRSAAANSNLDLYVVHLTMSSREPADPEQTFAPYIDQLFDKYNQDSSEVVESTLKKPQILFCSFFSLPELEDVVVNEAHDLVSPWIRHCHMVNSPLDDLEFESCFKEAKAVFHIVCPGTDFLPSPPDPENIIQIGDEAVSTTTAASANSGDLPFSSTPVPEESTSPSTTGDSGAIHRQQISGTPAGEEDRNEVEQLTWWNLHLQEQQEPGSTDH